MLTPEYLQGLPAELEQLYLRLEEETIADICRRIAKVGHISDTAEYQILRMRELGAGTEYIKSKIKEYSGLSADVVDRLFFDAAQVSDDFYKNAYAKAGKEYKPFEYNDFFQQIVVANVNQTKGELSNLTQSMGFSYRGSNGERRFRPVAAAYRECLDYAFTQVETGTTDYITAIRNATRRLTESGLQFVDYDSGVVNHVDVAVRRAVLTGISQVTGRISEHNAAELETDIVEVTAHAGARPDHAEWQGGWYSLSGKSKKYRSLAEATGYGRVDGLKGANCRHDFFPVIEGIDTPLYTKEELANIDPPPFEYNGKRYTYYEATQKQRSMERAIRKTKREILAADKTGDKDRFTEKSIRLRRQREEYDKFSKSAGLLTQNERNQVVGFGRSEASRASWAARSAQTLGNGPKGTPPSGGGNAPIRLLKTLLLNGNSSGEKGGRFASIGDSNKNLPQRILSKIFGKNVDNSRNGGKIEVEESTLSMCLDANLIEYNEVRALSRKLSTDEIIAKVGGCDPEGSCASLALAYIGNRNGIDVLDFRGGISRAAMADIDFENAIASLPGVKSNIVKSRNDFEAVNELMTSIEIGKEYFLSTGFHAAVVRKGENGFEYLELQDMQSQNKFKPLSKADLMERFSCIENREKMSSNILIDADSLKDNKYFNNILGYINTRQYDKS